MLKDSYRIPQIETPQALLNPIRFKYESKWIHLRSC